MTVPGQPPQPALACPWPCGPAAPSLVSGWSDSNDWGGSSLTEGETNGTPRGLSLCVARLRCAPLQLCRSRGVARHLGSFFQATARRAAGELRAQVRRFWHQQGLLRQLLRADGRMCRPPATQYCCSRLLPAIRSSGPAARPTSAKPCSQS